VPFAHIPLCLSLQQFNSLFLTLGSQGYSTLLNAVTPDMSVVSLLPYCLAQTLFQMWNTKVNPQQINYLRTAIVFELVAGARQWRVFSTRGDDKSLAQPTSRCHITESIMSLERGICSCAEFQVLSCYRDRKEACQATRGISTTSKPDLSTSLFFLQGKSPKNIRAIMKEKLGEEAPNYATVKNWVNHFKRGVMRLVLDDPKQ
jgi:hypothetical protein